MASANAGSAVIPDSSPKDPLLFAGSIEAQDSSCNVKQRFVVFRLFRPADENRAIAVDAAECLLDHPTPWLKSLFSNVDPLFAASTDMWSEPVALKPLPYPGTLIGCVQANVLFPISPRFWTADGDRSDCIPHESSFMPVGGADYDPEWDSPAVGENAPFGSLFASIGRVLPCFFPLPAAT